MRPLHVILLVAALVPLLVPSTAADVPGISTGTVQWRSLTLVENFNCRGTGNLALTSSDDATYQAVLEVQLNPAGALCAGAPLLPTAFTPQVATFSDIQLSAQGWYTGKESSPIVEKTFELRPLDGGAYQLTAWIWRNATLEFDRFTSVSMR